MNTRSHSGPTITDRHRRFGMRRPPRGAALVLRSVAGAGSGSGSTLAAAAKVCIVISSACVISALCVTFTPTVQQGVPHQSEGPEEV